MPIWTGSIRLIPHFQTQMRKDQRLYRLHIISLFFHHGRGSVAEDYAKNLSSKKGETPPKTRSSRFYSFRNTRLILKIQHTKRAIKGLVNIWYIQMFHTDPRWPIPHIDFNKTPTWWKRIETVCISPVRPHIHCRKVAADRHHSVGLRRFAWVWHPLPHQDPGAPVTIPKMSLEKSRTTGCLPILGCQTVDNNYFWTSLGLGLYRTNTKHPWKTAGYSWVVALKRSYHYKMELAG